MPFSNFRRKNRPNMGVRCQSISEKTGKLCGVAVATEDEDLMLITDTGTLIRIAASEVSLMKGSSATGVRVMRLADDASIVSFAVAEKIEEDEEAVTEETAEAVSENPETEVPAGENEV